MRGVVWSVLARFRAAMRDRGLVVRVLLVGFVLAAQVVGVAYARTSEVRYLAWAPYDSISQYDVEVTIDGEALAPEAVIDRYPLGLWIDGSVVRGRDNRSIAHVHHLIRRTEQWLDDNDSNDSNDNDSNDGGNGHDADGAHVVVTVRASINGRPAETWTWSP